VQHSSIVGGSTAKRVINCPGSVKLVQQVPPKPSSEHADRGTLLHDVIAELLEFDKPPQQCIGAEYKNQILTPELLDEKIIPALAALDVVDPDKTMQYMVETRVGFGDYLPGVFGSTDLLGRIGRRAIVLDWKFGDGVMVNAENNDQLLFYAAAAMRTPAAQWVFEDVDEIELIIVQPPEIRRWVTDKARVVSFEQELARAVRQAQQDGAELSPGEHCRWCAAKPICPQMNGAIDRAIHQQIVKLDKDQLGEYLAKADMLEDWVKDLRALAFQVLESGGQVPGYKLVAKRGTRQWVQDAAIEAWVDANGIEDAYDTKVKSPAQMEKVLKKHGKELPSDLVTTVSSGSTLAPESDPRPAVLQIGKQLTAALSKL
jgi:hypothetical protein